MLDGANLWQRLRHVVLPLFAAGDAAFGDSGRGVDV